MDYEKAEWLDEQSDAVQIYIKNKEVRDTKTLELARVLAKSNRSLTYNECAVDAGWLEDNAAQSNLNAASTLNGLWRKGLVSRISRPTGRGPIFYYSLKHLWNCCAIKYRVSDSGKIRIFKNRVTDFLEGTADKQGLHEALIEVDLYKPGEMVYNEAYKIYYEVTGEVLVRDKNWYFFNSKGQRI